MLLWRIHPREKHCRKQNPRLMKVWVIQYTISFSSNVMIDLPVAEILKNPAGICSLYLTLCFALYDCMQLFFLSLKSTWWEPLPNAIYIYNSSDYSQQRRNHPCATQIRRDLFFFNAKKFELHLLVSALGKIVKSIKLTGVVESTGSGFKQKLVRWWTFLPLISWVHSVQFLIPPSISTLDCTKRAVLVPTL